jgi:DNA polymerase family A
MGMNTLFLDFETMYSADYSLSHLMPPEYILDPRFEAIGCAVKEGLQGKTYWVDGPDLPGYFAGLDPQTTQTVTFNALFDNCIMAWRYNFVPRLMTDAMGMSRAMLGHVLKSHSLRSVASFLELGIKGDTVHNVKGMCRQAILDAGLMPAYIEYSCLDNDLCAGVYERLLYQGYNGNKFPVSELAVMDMVLRCAVQPKFKLDRNMLALHAAEVRAKKEGLLAEVGLAGEAGKSLLMSSDKFAELLRTQGVDPPTKTSPTTGKEIYAFAKGDQAMVDLAEHPDERVQALVGARLGHKSTLEETRTERLIRISGVTWQGNEQQLMPVPLGYGRAHTHRLGGEWKLNMQNLPARQDTTLRKALVVGDDEEVVTVDASQIECRVAAALVGQDDLVLRFELGEDVYAWFATLVFGMDVTKATHPAERFMGKTGVLGLGFGSGWATFQNAVKTQSLQQLGYQIVLTDEEAQKIVSDYRRLFSKFPAAWRRLQLEGISALANGSSFKFGPCEFEKGAINLPSGLQLHYDNLSMVHDERGTHWTFTFGGKPKYIYGGKLFENVVQALARIITMDAGVRIQRRAKELGTWLGLQCHDELAYVVTKDHAGQLRQILAEECSKRSSWLPNAPIACELGPATRRDGSWIPAKSYGDAK